ncbi:MAG: hypothetical protein JXR86_06955 [Spirochaetales bacterium]|nr:hypothetical protein [Spirochaetales bacterium]
MKKTILRVSLLLCFFHTFAQGNVGEFNGTFYPNPDVTYIFRDGTLTIDEFISKGSKRVESFKYLYEEDSKIPFLYIEKDGEFQKYLAIYSDDFLLLYKMPKSSPDSGGFWGRSIYDLFLSSTSFTTSSSYSDSKYDFSSGNLGDMTLFKPWVEGVSGVGKGEKIEAHYADELTITGFYISNGFVSYEKPYLYEYNSRVKRIKVSNSENSFSLEYNVKDSPNLQYFKVPETTDIIIEILDVYDGSKWDDTSINFILLESQL